MNETEQDFESWFLDLAKLNGWHCAHFRPTMVLKRGIPTYRTAVQGEGKGYPDWTLTKDRVLFIELKSESGKLSEAQEAWRDWLIEAGAEWYCFRPSDRARIEELLK